MPLGAAPGWKALVSPVSRETTSTIATMATSEIVVKTIQPSPGQLCAPCAGLVPGEHTVQVDSKHWGTLKSFGPSAQSCSLCKIILSARQNWLDESRKEKGDLDETTLDECPLSLKLTPTQLSESGVSSNTLVIFLAMGGFLFPEYFFIMSCESEGMLFLWQ